MSQTNQVPILSYSLPTAVSEHYPAVHGGEGPQWTGASRAEQGGVSVGVKRLRYQGLGRLATPVQPTQADSNGWWCPGPEAEVQLRDTGPTEDLVMGLLICGLSRLNLALTGEVRAPTTHYPPLCFSTAHPSILSWLRWPWNSSRLSGIRQGHPVAPICCTARSVPHSPFSPALSGANKLDGPEPDVSSTLTDWDD